MACQLSLLHIPFIIVEKEKGPTKESRALGIQARTLEIFDQMGIVERFVAEGEKASGLNFMSNGKVIQHVPLSGLGEGLTKFPYLLTLEQSRTESFMLDFLKKHDHKITWDTTVVSFTQTDHEVTSVVKDSSGKEQTIVSDYIIGADGAHSIVRHILGTPLAGKTYQQSLFVLDCKIKTNLSRENITVSTSDEAFAAFFPMTNNRWRIVGEAPPSSIGKDTITFDEVNKDFAQRLRMDFTLFDPEWISLYHAHHRCVSHFREKRAFLLGDAANIHSPIGAQGMNTGLQDAYNLAWKIAFVQQDKTKEAILDTYNEERLPFAKRLVETTDRLFNLFVSNNRGAILLRERILPLIVNQVVTHKKSGAAAFRTVSQIGISYHKSYLSQDGSGDFLKNAPLPGDRLPYVQYKENSKEKNIQDAVTIQHFELLLFSGSANKVDTIREQIKPYEKAIHITEIPKSDETQELYKKFGIKNFGYYLVRPDRYIAYRSTTKDTTPLIEYLHRIFS